LPLEIERFSFLDQFFSIASNRAAIQYHVGEALHPGQIISPINATADY
jgi:hypothetical protein